MRPLAGVRRRVRRLRMQGLPGRRREPAVSSLPLPPVFVGGTGRSGTTILGGLLGSHPRRFVIPQEAKFHSAVGGLCDLVEGRTTLARFETQLADKWFDRGPRMGLHRFLEWAEIEAALVELRQALRSDPERAAAAFTYRLLDPLAARAGASGWVEMTPTNVLAAPTLLRLFPGMRLVHSVRDGRDVACSVVRQRWGATDLDDALDWWGRKLERAFAVTASLPPDRVLVVQLEDLVTHDREGQLKRLLAFLDLDDDPAVRAFFEDRMIPARAHSGRWRQDVPPERLAAFEAHYAALAAGLVNAGRPYHPDGHTRDASPAA